jgi:L-asparaginase
MSLTLVATGGTIASTRGDDGTVAATRSGADLLAMVPDAADVEVVDLPVPGSWNMSGTHALRVALAARDALAEGATGVVVTHGTDVLEETAFLTELVARSATVRGPIVFTAAMRHGSEFAPDGPRNLADALAVARDPAAVGRGVLVCLNGELHHARWVAKVHATALQAFASPGRAAVGAVDESGVRFHLGSPPPPADPPESPGMQASVPILVSHWDSDEDLVAWHLERGAAGLVVEAGGAGNVNVGLLAGIDLALAQGVPVVVASRCLGGQVTPIYGGAGGFATLAAKGAIASAGLTAGKARLALQVALGLGGSTEEVRSYFESLSDEQVAAS